MKSFRDYLVNEVKIPAENIITHAVQMKLESDPAKSSADLDSSLTDLEIALNEAVSCLRACLDGVVERFGFKCKSVNAPLERMVEHARDFYTSIGYIPANLSPPEEDPNHRNTRWIMICRGKDKYIATMEYFPQEEILTFGIITYDGEIASHIIFDDLEDDKLNGV